MQGTLFGLTEERIAELGMTWGVGAFIALMLFIIWKLARDSKAGRLGTFILFFVLAFGIMGFVAKTVLQWMLEP
jgi:4-amino-4-deoxy-L-arabinose transferase-like glycosyltransferase